MGAAAAANLQKFCYFNSGLVGIALGRCCSCCSERMISGSIRAIVGIWMENGQICFRRGSACSKCCRAESLQLAVVLQNQSCELHTVLQSGKWSRGKFYKCLISIMYFGHCCYRPGIHNCCRNVFKSIMIVVPARARPPIQLGNREKELLTPDTNMAGLPRLQRNWNMLPHRHGASWPGHDGDCVTNVTRCLVTSWHLVTHDGGWPVTTQGQPHHNLLTSPGEHLH